MERPPSRLFEAARSGDLATVRALIESGAEVDASDDARRTPLFVAVKQGHLDVARCLLEAGADPNTIADYDPDESRVRPLTPAELEHRDRLTKQVGSQVQNFSVLVLGDEMLEQVARGAIAGVNAVAGASTITVDDYIFYAPLHVAARLGHEAMIDLLIASGAEIELAVTGGRRRRPLHIAAIFGQADAVRRLIAAGARVDAVAEFTTRTPNTGRTALSYAIERGHAEVARLLTEAGARETGTQAEALMRMVQEGDAAGVARALGEGLDPNTSTPDYRSPFLAACNSGDASLVAAFLDAGATVTGQALENVAFRRSTDILTLLLQRGRRFDVSLAKSAEVRRIAKREGWEDVPERLKEIDDRARPRNRTERGQGSRRGRG